MFFSASMLKLFVDFVVPDVPSKMRVQLARDEHMTEMRVREEMAMQAIEELENEGYVPGVDLNPFDNLAGAFAGTPFG